MTIKYRMLVKKKKLHPSDYFDKILQNYIPTYTRHVILNDLCPQSYLSFTWQTSYTLGYRTLTYVVESDPAPNILPRLLDHVVPVHVGEQAQTEPETQWYLKLIVDQIIVSISRIPFPSF